MFSSILAAIAAIPELLKALQGLIAYFKKAEEAGWFSEKAKAFQILANAKTEEEYAAASKAISDLLRRS